MIINILENVTGKYKTGLMKRQVVELYRMNVYSEHQILEAVGISRTLLRRWNRYYDRYRNKKRVYIKMYGSMKTKTTNELAALRRKVAELEQYSSKLLLEKQALETVIMLAEDQFKIPIRKKSGPKQ